LVHYSEILDSSLTMIPWIAFLAGIGGSLHCVGMCGGLVVTCAPTKKSVFTYQIGRLLGYSFLGLLAGSLGHLLTFSQTSPAYSLIPAFLIGGLLIFWGLKSWLGKKAELPVPQTFRKFHMNIWQKMMGKTNGSTKSFTIGALSIFLPCGLLYGVVLTVASFQNPLIGLMSMFFFWLGTVPAMNFAPDIVRRVFKPLVQKLPRMTALCLIGIGVFTISSRVYGVYMQASGATCH